MTRHDQDEPGARGDPLTHALAERDARVLDTVRDALDRDAALLAFQPVIRASDGRPAFHEALIRLRDGDGQVLRAGRFLPEIEETELGREVDVTALRLGLDALASVPDLRLSVNMSARSIGYARWMDVLRCRLDREETVGERLILEITESSAMLVPELVRTFMAELQDRGVTFALDDFGAGATCFRYLKEFYFDILKVDGAFVRGCDTDPDNQCILGALVAVGQQFDMFTVAESVETAAEARFLARAGFDCLQGFHCGAPLTRPPWLDPQAGPRPTAAIAQAG